MQQLELLACKHPLCTSMGLPAPKIIEEVQTENGGTIKIKISMMGKNRQASVCFRVYA